MGQSLGQYKARGLTSNMARKLFAKVSMDISRPGYQTLWLVSYHKLTLERGILVGLVMDQSY